MYPIMKRTLTILAAMALLVLPRTALAGSETTSKPEEKAPAESPIIRAARENRERTDKGKEVQVFTNADLDRLFGAPPPPSAAEPDQTKATGSDASAQAPAAEDPLKWMADQKAKESEREAQIASAEKKVAEAQDKIASLEQRIRSIRNPLLPPPKPPEDAQAREDWDASNAKGRLEESQSELDRARDELRAAQDELAALRGQ